jgi:hypothetical protein
MFNLLLDDAKKVLPLIPARRNRPPTRTEFFRKFRDHVVLWTPTEELEALSSADNDTGIDAAMKTYEYFLMMLWVNYDGWTLRDIARKCVALNALFRGFFVVAVYTEDSEDTLKTWRKNQAAFAHNAGEMLDQMSC